MPDGGAAVSGALQRDLAPAAISLPETPRWLGLDPSPASGSARVAAGLLSGDLVELDLDTGESRGLGALDGGVLVGSWSPVGGHLGVGGPAGAALWGPDGMVTLPVARWCAAMAWADGDRLAVADGKRAHVVDRTGALLWSTPEVASTVIGLLWVRGGRELGLACYGGVTFFSRGRAAPSRHLAYQGSLLSVAATPDASWVASGNQDATIHVWRALGSDELEMGGFPFKVAAVAFDGSGRWLAATGAPEVTVWDFAGAGPAGSRPRMLSGHDAGAGVLAWHQHRPVLAAGGAGLVTVWHPVPVRPGQTTDPAARYDVPGGVTSLLWSGDDLVVATDQGQVRVLAEAGS